MDEISKDQFLIQIEKLQKEIKSLKSNSERQNEEIERLSNIVSTVSDGYIDWNIETDKVFCDSRFCKLLNINESTVDIEMELIRHLIHPEERHDYIYELENYLKSLKEDFIYDVRMKIGSGNYKWIRSRGKVIQCDEKGIPKRMVFAYTDVTESKLAKQHLKRREERLNLAFEASNDGIWDWNVQSGETYYSPRNYTMLGYKPFEIPSDHNTWLNMLHPEDRKAVEKRLDTYIKNKSEYYEEEFRLRCKTGEYKWILSRGKLVEVDSEQKPLRMIGTHVDITENKNMLIALKKSEQKFREMFESNCSMMYLVDPISLKVVDVNGSAIRYYGYDRKQFLKMKLSDFINMKEKQLAKQLKSCIVNNNEPLVVKSALSDGLIRDVEIRSTPVTMDDGNILLFSIVYDITDRVRAKKMLLESERRLRVKLDYILSSDVADESFSLLDLIDLEELQQIQESFAKATDVASIITDVDGNPLTKPSNFSDVCNIVRNTEKGKASCVKSDRILGDKARKLMKPTYQRCLSCGFTDASAPIIVGGKHIANWLIGQRDISTKLSEKEIKEFADNIQADKEELWNAYRKRSVINKEQFEEVLNLLWVFAKKLSSLAYNNLQLERDIVLRKTVEQSLRESEEKFRLISEQSLLAIIILQDGRIKYANRAYSNMVGYKTDDILKWEENEYIKTIHKDDLTFVQKQAEKKQNGMTDDVVEQYSYRSVSKNGEVKWVEVFSKPIKYENKTADLVTLLDINERKNAEEEIIRAKEKAEEMNKLKSEFLANMSHELRTPLNSILGFCQLMSRFSFASKEEIQNYINLIYSSGKHLLEIINDILDISKVESGNANVRLEEIDFIKLLEEIKLSTTNQLIEKDIDFEIIVGSTVPHKIYTDYVKLKQVFLNLIGNAIKFTSDGYVIVNVKFISSEDRDGSKDNYLFVSIKDTGIGIPKDKHDIVFESFTQADGSVTREYGGTGLGLYISKKLVDLLGGKIWFDSEKYKGTTFYFTVKCFENKYYKEIWPKKLRYELTEQEQVVIDLRKSRILLVEDDHTTVKLLVMLLNKFNSDVIVATNGEEGIKKALMFSPELIFMDIQLPVLDGIKATKILRKKQQFAKIPIIALTAFAMKGDRERFIDAGCTDYLSKPISFDKLENILLRYVEIEGKEHVSMQ